MSTQVSLGGVRTKAPESIVLSDIAAKKVAELLAAEDDKSLVLRVAVRPGGCSGFSYEMFFDADVADDDHIDDYKGVKVAVDAASKPHLKGATLEYKDALQGGGFTINNPNAERTCGCGQSFS